MGVPCKAPRIANRIGIATGAVSVVRGKGVIEGDEIERADCLIWNIVLDQDVEVEEVTCPIGSGGWVSRVICSFFLTCYGAQLGVGLLHD